MLLWENIVLAINGLLSNKMRAFLTMLGIIIGIGSVIAIITVGDSVTLSVSENMQSMGANDIFVFVQNRTDDGKEEQTSIDGIKYGTYASTGEITDDDLMTPEMFKDLTERFHDEIYAIILNQSVSNITVSNGNKEAVVNVNGVTPGFFITNSTDIIKGNMLSQKDFEESKNAIIVADRFVNKLYDGNYDEALGQEIELNVENQIQKFTIVGIYEYTEQYVGGMSLATGDDVTTNIYMPLTSYNNFTHSSSRYMYAEIVSNVGVDPDEFSVRVKSFFEPYYRNNPDYKVNAITMSTMLSMLTSMLSTITLAISVIAAIALLVGGIGVMNIMLVSVTERTREIGTRKALGAKNSSIRIQFIVEAMIICLIGGIFGVIVGIVGGMAASSALGYPAQPSISAIVTSLAFSMTIGVFFGYYPANKAAKMNPIDALRYE